MPIAKEMSTPDGARDYYQRPDKPITFHFNDYAIHHRPHTGFGYG
jgi:hypothetical protein